MKNLYIDIETYSSVDIKSHGAYKYLESPDFEILMIAYAYDDEPVRIVDLAQGETMPDHFLKALQDHTIRKHAHNATFERQAFKNFGLQVPVNQWFCSMIKAAYCGLPLSLDMVSKVLQFDEDKAKLATGKALIRYFSTPCKPTKTNGGRTRNLPHHDPEKWEQYKMYCMQDVEAEREIERRLNDHDIPEMERALYILDQDINDRGILIDTLFAKNAFKVDQEHSEALSKELIDITGVDNPNSLTQLKEWISEATGEEIPSLAKDEIQTLIDKTDIEQVGEVLRLRQKASKSSTKKYVAALNCVCDDRRAHGLFQFYGANRTGRWAGRLIQLQNLPQNHLQELDLARQFVRSGDLDGLNLLYDDVSDTLSQLIRTTFVAPEGKILAVADFSAIEARVIAWLAEEAWRVKVFNSHGKIYEASASMMFKVPIEDITKGSEYRQKGKIAELALGYQGGVGALKTMGGEQMGLTEPEMKEIVHKWRASNPAIVQLWKDLEGCAKQAIKSKKPVISTHRGLVFESNGSIMTIKLPSGRKLFYANPEIRIKPVRLNNGENWNSESIRYMGMDQVKKQWARLETYGGKLAENIVQAIARDLLGEAMLRIDKQGFNIVMHVHDEVACEVSLADDIDQLERMCYLMGEPVSWAPGLPLNAAGYLTKYYKKD